MRLKKRVVVVVVFKGWGINRKCVKVGWGIETRYVRRVYRDD